MIARAVQAPCNFLLEHAGIQQREAEDVLRGASMPYKGFSVKTQVKAAQPVSEQGWVLVQGSDAYSFFITMEKIQLNSSLLLTLQVEVNQRFCHLIGAKNSNAWVRCAQAFLVVSPPRMAITAC